MLGLTTTAPSSCDEPTTVQPLLQAHAHNDYEHARPLHDALSHGFTSVEADVYLVEGKLLVAHDRSDARPDRTLESLYLDPLRDRARQFGGRIYQGGPTLTLLIDIKSEAEATYAALRGVLAGYRDILTRVDNGQLHSGAVTVVISGNRPQETIAAETTRYAGIDGRLTDLGSDRPSHLLPLISDNWQLHFTWNGAGDMPGAEREKLRSIVSRAHERGRRVRFWATPDNEALWRELVAAEVDLINTDNLAGLEAFLRKSAPATGKGEH
ncbi:MAG: hypothetical protein HY000_14785 [Planctomycetes bacterium]|nr:hypothetical protein [Planctomycetota bacterium]